MIAVEFGGERAISFEGSREGLLEQDAIAGGDERGGVLIIIFGGRDDYGGVADVGRS